MKLVREHIEFQKNVDPKAAMGTGVWSNPQQALEIYYNIIPSQNEWLIQIKNRQDTPWRIKETNDE